MGHHHQPVRREDRPLSRYSATVEWITPAAGVLRVHRAESAAVGDPYVWAATLDKYGRLATIKGVCRPLGKDAMRAVCDELYRQGMRLRLHERRAGAHGWRKVLKTIQPPREDLAACA